MFYLRTVTPAVAQSEVLAACWDRDYTVAFDIDHANAMVIKVLPCAGSTGRTVICFTITEPVFDSPYVDVVRRHRPGEKQAIFFIDSIVT